MTLSPDITRLVAIDIETTGHAVPTAEAVQKMPKGLKLAGIVIQIGCVEILRDGDGWTTGEAWETLVNPDGPMRPGARNVHGIHPNALKTAPRFPDVRGRMDEFLGEAPLVAHSAMNERDFLNFELRRAKLIGWSDEAYVLDRFLDTQVLGRATFPGASASLDTLCDRLWIDRSDRFQFHGALLDAQLTAEAWIKLTTGFVTDDVRTFSV